MKNYYFFIVFIFLLFISSCEKDATPYRLESPIWNFSNPEEQDMNPQVLDSAFIKAKQTGFVDGLLVIRNGHLVAEEYYNGYNEATPHNVMSVSKSFLSAIMGIALQQGFIDSLNEKMLNYFPEYIYTSMDPRKYNITIRHLLTMRMGIRDESDDNYGVYWEFYNSNNWIKKTIEDTLIDSPGSKMHYNTFQTHLLSAIITKATQKSTLDFAKEVLFDPMKIGIDAWEQDPQGYYFGGNSMYFTPREMAVLGFLYLNNGRINGRQLVPADWVKLTLSPSTNFTHPNEWGAFKNYDYAYLWWLGQIENYDMFMGYGYGGQFVVVFPSLNLIIVSTAKNQVDPDASTVQEWAIFDIIADYILPSIGDVSRNKDQKLSINTDSTSYSWQQGESDDYVHILGTLRNKSDTIFYSSLGDGFGPSEQGELHIACNSDGSIEKYNESNNSWEKSDICSYLIEGTRVASIKPAQDYSIFANIAKKRDEEENGKYRIRINYYSRQNPDTSAIPFQSYSNAFQLK